MTTQTNPLAATWSPIIGGLDEEELSCVVNLALARLGSDFGKPYSLTLNTNPSNTVTSATPPAIAAAQGRSRFAGKRWLRVVDQIDLTKKGGFSIIGGYTHATRIGQVPDGKLVVVAERQGGTFRVAIVQKTTTAPPSCDVFGDGTFDLKGVSFIARSDGATTNLATGGTKGYAPSLAAQTPTQFHGTPWATIIAVLKHLNVPTV